MTQEEKAKAYDDAFKEASVAHKDEDRHLKATLERIFPELRESEDDRIRKAIIEHFEGSHSSMYPYKGFTKEQILAWLEKQGEQKHTAEEVLIKAGLKPYKDGDQWCVLLGDNIQEGICGFGNTIEDALYAFLKDLIASQGKQNPADKVEPKFKVGNWYQCTKDFFGKGVTFDKNTAYYCEKEGCLKNEYGCHIAIVKDLYDNFKLWTIDDAKDGDVLTCYSDIKGQPIEQTGIIKQYFGRHGGCSNSFKAHFGVDWDNNVVIEGYMGSSNIYPATKEQRDILFQKMKEAGYEWDTEKKELKKVEQPSAWSKEDEIGLGDALWAIQQARTIAKDENDMGNLWYAENWLKSLKDRMQPKLEWSEEDEKMLENAISSINHDSVIEGLKSRGISYSIVSSAYLMENLITWLKSLKNRVQPKQEWSEEKEKDLFNAAKHLREYAERCVQGEYSKIEIFSLADRIESIRPQIHWKPSDEQMEAMGNAIKPYCKGYGWDETPLGTLYNDLKKL